MYLVVVFVEVLVDEELFLGYGVVGVEIFFVDDVYFVVEVE